MDGIRRLVNSYVICVWKRGDYVEKWCTLRVTDCCTWTNKFTLLIDCLIWFKFTMYDLGIAFIVGVNQWHVIYTVSLLCPWAQQLHYIESLHLQGYPLTAAMLRDDNMETCNVIYFYTEPLYGHMVGQLIYWLGLSVFRYWAGARDFSVLKEMSGLALVPTDSCSVGVRSSFHGCKVARKWSCLFTSI